MLHDGDEDENGDEDKGRELMRKPLVVVINKRMIHANQVEMLRWLIKL